MLVFPEMKWTAAKIRKTRIAAGLTQRQLAAWLKVSVIQVQHLENDRRKAGGSVMRLLDILSAHVKASNVKPILSTIQKGARK
jgi:DNA-binding transcriptional regulator YiaG